MGYMKKLMTIFLVLSIVLLVACNGGNSSDNSVNTGKPSSNEGTYSIGGNSLDDDKNSFLNNQSSYQKPNESSEKLENSSADIPNSSSDKGENSSTGGSMGGEQKPLTEDISDPQKPIEYAYDFTNGAFNGVGVTPDVSIYSASGYASDVTGGGVLNEKDAKYLKVSTAEEFINAIGRRNPADKNDETWYNTPMVVEVMNDIDLGYNVIGSSAQANADVIDANAPSVHPTLKKTGVSVVYISGRQNLTIFSKNGACIKHACFQIRGYDGRASSNIMIRNLKFIGSWEWDDSGKYDANDWDTFTIRADKGAVEKIWIDHCTFTKPYDGTIDIKYNATDITISWCAFIPYTTDDSDFMDMMNYLESNRSSFPNYNQARNGGASFEDMLEYATINKKVHLIGHTDNNPGDENIRVTYANNYYYNCTERLPRLRLGKAHVYNCIFNAERANTVKNKLKVTGSWPSALGFDANGSLGTNYGQLLVENCYINGINCPLRNNNKKAEDQYTGSCEALTSYYTCVNINRSWSYDNKTNSQVSKSGRYTFFGSSTKDDANNLLKPFPMKPLNFDTDAFKSALPYEYILFNPTELYLTQNGIVGADKMDFSEKLWMTSNYTNEKTSNLVRVNGVNGKTANLGLGRK